MERVKSRQKATSSVRGVGQTWHRDLFGAGGRKRLRRAGRLSAVKRKGIAMPGPKTSVMPGFTMKIEETVLDHA